MRGFSRRLALTALGVVVFGTLVAFGAGAGATGTAALGPERPVDRVVMFASDGMRRIWWRSTPPPAPCRRTRSS